MGYSSQPPGLSFARVVAAFLAVGGGCWGLMCLLVICTASDATPLLLFGPGYVVTIGYIFRTIVDPSRGVRLWIWGSSAVVQGAWWGGVTAFLLMGYSQGRPFEGLNILYIWWTFATFASIWGVFFDRPARMRHLAPSS